MTGEVLGALPELADFDVGLLHLLIQHTSASLTLNENASPEVRADLDTWLVDYNQQRPHQGRWCFGKTPMQTFLDAIPLTMEKLMAA